LQKIMIKNGKARDIKHFVFHHSLFFFSFLFFSFLNIAKDNDKEWKALNNMIYITKPSFHSIKGPMTI
jgi:hypothetical protein